MTDFTRKQPLLNHPQVSGLGTPLGGCGALFGLPFIAAGAFILLVALGIGPEQKDAPPPAIFATMGVVFTVAGVLVTSLGLRGMLESARRRKVREQHPDEPWREHPWDEREAKDRSPGPLSVFAVATFLSLFLSIFNYFVFVEPEGDVPVFAKVMVGLFDLIALGAWGHGFYVLGRRLKYGHPRVRFAVFPLEVGKTLRVGLDLPASLTHAGRLDAVLRCAEQVWETQRMGSKSKRVLVTYELWSEKRSLDAGAVGPDLSLSFDLPADAPSTDFGATQARFWELQLDMETPGIDYHAMFLLPVYALPKRT